MTRLIIYGPTGKPVTKPVVCGFVEPQRKFSWEQKPAPPPRPTLPGRN